MLQQRPPKVLRSAEKPGGAPIPADAVQWINERFGIDGELIVDEIQQPVAIA
jgi:hypothetical protein